LPFTKALHYLSSSVAVGTGSDTTAPAEKDGWKTVEGKAAQKKRRNNKADNKSAVTTRNNTPKMMNSERGKNTHKL
jgi:hypothetical protein